MLIMYIVQSINNIRILASIVESSKFISKLYGIRVYFRHKVWTTSDDIKKKNFIIFLMMLPDPQTF